MKKRMSSKPLVTKKVKNQQENQNLETLHQNLWITREKTWKRVFQQVKRPNLSQYGKTGVEIETKHC